MPSPCIQPDCPTLTTGGRCKKHRRNRNLARDTLPQIAARDNWTCHLCGQPVDPALRGSRDPKAPSLHHLDDTTDHPTNLVLAHFNCNSSAG